MDVTGIVGEVFGAIAYLVLYTSKVDKMAYIGDLMQKLEDSDDSNTKGLLRKTLLHVDSKRAVIAPEAAANLLQYPHWQASSTVIRIGVDKYLTEKEKLIVQKMQKSN